MTPGDDCPHELVRHTTPRSRDELAARFGLANEPGMQDWEVQVADTDRLVDFLAGYDDEVLDADDRFALMALIIASLDDAVSTGLDVAPIWATVARLLRREPALHATTMSYWSCGSDPDPEHGFAVTPLVRPLWQDVLQELGPRPLAMAPHGFDERATVVTPLGRVILTIDDGGSPLVLASAGGQGVLPLGGRLSTYRTDRIEATLVVGEVSPRLPPGMQVAHCVAALWRFRARERLEVLRFSCRCAELPVDAVGGPTSGEGLEALTWDLPGWVMSIGTPDGELLAVDYAPDGLRVSMANVPADENLLIHFLVAWAARAPTRAGNDETRNEEWDASTWFAVDQDAAWVLAELTAGTG